MNELVELLDETAEKKQKADSILREKTASDKEKSESNPRILRNLPCLWRFHL